ncbi:hypothetical protein PLICRDRAFT_396627 [Plicaturopsis crispa FD-325 SS-3]|nr:hypothetical protein PLICRDRAFT_396627 [Plicaturopsis crispa FD-325 SS-3]
MEENPGNGQQIRPYGPADAVYAIRAIRRSPYFTKHSTTAELLRPQLTDGVISEHDYNHCVSYFPHNTLRILQNNPALNYIVVPAWAPIYGRSRPRPWSVPRCVGLSVATTLAFQTAVSIYAVISDIRFLSSAENAPRLLIAFGNVWKAHPDWQRPLMRLPVERSVGDEDSAARYGDAAAANAWEAPAHDQSSPPDESFSDPPPMQSDNDLGPRSTPPPVSPPQTSIWDEIRKKRASSPTSSWDALRQDHERRVVRGSGSSDAPSEAKDERTLEQERFDAMLEQERRASRGES